MLMQMIFVMVLFAISLLFPKKIYAQWNDCTFNKVNDPYPGSCFRYTDTNEDNICDKSQIRVWIDPRLNIDKGTENSYIIVLFLTLSIYFLHWYLTNKTNVLRNLLNKDNFAFFWNIVLLISFLITCITGILMLFLSTSKLTLWHNYGGLVFTVIGLFHLFDRLKYFKSFLSRTTRDVQNLKQQNISQ